MSADVCSPCLASFCQKDVKYSPPPSPAHSPPPSPTDVGGKKTFDTGPMSVAEEVACMMGIPPEDIKMATAYHRLRHGTDTATAQQLLAAAEELAHCPEKQQEVGKLLSEAKQPKKDEETQTAVWSAKKVQDKDAHITGQDSVSASAEMQAKSLAESRPVVGDMAELKETVQKLAKENHRLRQRKTCRACRKVDLASSGVTFLPCGHFVTCESCSEMYDDCPACGKSIMGTVRTFLS